MITQSIADGSGSGSGNDDNDNNGSKSSEMVSGAKEESEYGREEELL